MGRPPRPLDRYLAVRRFTSLVVSPDGREVAYCADISGQWNVWRKPLSGRPQQRTFFEEEVARAIAWSPARDEMCVAADRHGDENFALYRLVGDDGWPELLTAKPDAKHILSPHAFSPDGRRLAYAVNDRRPADFDVCVRDLETGAVQRLLADGRYSVVWGWTPDGTRLLLLDANANDDVDLRVLDVATGAVRCVTDWPGKSVVDVQAVSPDSRRALVTCNRDREFLGLAWLDLAGGDLSWIETPEHDIEAAALSRDGSRLALVVNEDGASRLSVRDTGSGKVCASPALPLAQIEDLAFTPDGQAIVYRANAAVRPNSPYVLRLDATKPTRLHAGLLGPVVPDDLVAPESVRIPSFDQRQVQAWLFRPPAARGPVPVLLSIHGGPEAQERPVYHALYQYLLHRGVAILAPNIRGSTGFGVTYQRLIHRDFGGADLRDLAACAQHLVAAPWADRTRLGVFGGSYGGFAALSCATRLPEYWACAVSVVGPSNLVTFARSVPPSWKRFMKDWVGDPDEDREMLLHRSPISYVERMRAPLLVLQGAKDPRVVKAESDQMVDRLKTRGVPVEYHVFDDEGHGFMKKRNQVRAWNVIAQFLLKHFRVPAGTA